MSISSSRTRLKILCEPINKRQDMHVNLDSLFYPLLLKASLIQFYLIFYGFILFILATAATLAKRESQSHNISMLMGINPLTAFVHLQ